MSNRLTSQEKDNVITYWCLDCNSEQVENFFECPDCDSDDMIAAISELDKEDMREYSGFGYTKLDYTIAEKEVLEKALKRARLERNNKQERISLKLKKLEQK